MEAVLCAPNETANNRRQMWFFVEKRWVEDSTLYAAIMSAYRGLLMHGEYPIVVLSLSCRKEDIDVNVHPSKSKVRFKNSSSVFKAIHHSLRAVLEKAPWINNPNQKSAMHKDKENELRFPDTTFDKVHFQKSASVVTPPPRHTDFYGDTSSLASTIKKMKMEPPPAEVHTLSEVQGNKKSRLQGNNRHIGLPWIFCLRLI